MSNPNTPSGPERSVEELAKDAAIKHVNKIWEDTKFLQFERDGCMNHFIAGYQAGFLAASPQPKDTSGMQWVKASERLPQRKGYENTVIIKGNGFGKDPFGHSYSHSFLTKGFVNFDEKEPRFYFTIGNKSFLTNEGIEWLDESSPLLSTQQGERMFTLEEIIDAHTAGVLAGNKQIRCHPYTSQHKYFKEKFDVNL